MDAAFFTQQQRLVARMTEALVDARAQIAVDRASLFDSSVGADGTVSDDDKPPLDEYDRVLEQIDVALDFAKGEAA
jgi:hypothetical protein